MPAARIRATGHLTRSAAIGSTAAKNRFSNPNCRSSIRIDHLWQRPGWRYLLEDMLGDTGSGHNVVATVYMEARSMCRDQGPEEMRPVGETEFANGIAAMCSSGIYGKTRACAAIVGHADLT